jgi:hypothetical protein
MPARSSGAIITSARDTFNNAIINQKINLLLTIIVVKYSDDTHLIVEYRSPMQMSTSF